MTIMIVMAKKQPFRLIYDPETAEHLEAIEVKYHSLIRDAIEEQLRFEPETITRNRKPLERPINLGARWELRLGGEAMRIASVADIKARLSSYLRATAAGPVVVTRNGKAVAVLVGVSDDEELERLLLAHSPKLRAILDAADRRIDQGAGIEHDDFWRQVESKSRSKGANGNGKKRRNGR